MGFFEKLINKLIGNIVICHIEQTLNGKSEFNEILYGKVTATRMHQIEDNIKHINSYLDGVVNDLALSRSRMRDIENNLNNGRIDKNLCKKWLGVLYSVA